MDMELSNYILTKLKQYIIENRRIPKYFVAYNCTEEKDYCCTLGTQCGYPGHIGNLLVIEYDLCITDARK